MKIVFYDKFKEFQHFINVFRKVWEMLNDDKTEISSMVIYATLKNKETGKIVDIKDEEGNVAGLAIGRFPYVEIIPPDSEEPMQIGDNVSLIRWMPEKEMLSKMYYDDLCKKHNRKKELENLFPVCRYQKSGYSKKYDTADDAIKAGYDINSILKAVKTGKTYEGSYWKRGETID